MENLVAKEELEKGREFANQLRGMIFRSGDEDDVQAKALTTSSAEDLVAKVLNSFTNALSLFDHHHHVPADSSTPSFSHMPANSDESHESPKNTKTRSPTTIIKDQRISSLKKRKIIHTWEDDSKMSPKEDGHAWRKYGQKIILNSKHPRNYFRCTHKHEQGCKATKQVQKIQDDPPLYRTTYFGHHTCTNLLNPHMFFDDSHDPNSTSACILRFDNNQSNHSITTFDQQINNNNNNTISFLAQQSHLFLSSSSLFPSVSSVRNEDQHCPNIKQDTNNYNINDNINVVVPPPCSSNDCFVSPHEEAVLPSGYGNNQEDVFDSSAFYEPDVFEDYSLFEMIHDHQI